MSAQPQSRFTPEQYLTREREAETKSEYFGGEIYPRTGASRKHNLIVSNVVAALHRQLRARPCEIYPSDMRVRVSATGLYTYPDVVVVCGEPRFDDDYNDTLVNPSVLVEVLSKSTEAYDRGAKFEQDRTIPELSDYLLISQDRCHIEHFMRQPDNYWLFSESKELAEVVNIRSINCELVLGEVYEKVDLS